MNQFIKLNPEVCNVSIHMIKHGRFQCINSYDLTHYGIMYQAERLNTAARNDLF